MSKGARPVLRAIRGATTRPRRRGRRRHEKHCRFKVNGAFVMAPTKATPLYRADKAKVLGVACEELPPLSTREGMLTFAATMSVEDKAALAKALKGAVFVNLATFDRPCPRSDDVTASGFDT